MTKLKHHLIKWLGGIPVDSHQWFVDELLEIIGKQDAAFIVRGNTSVNDIVISEKPVIVSGNRIRVNHLRLENGARIICDPTTKNAIFNNIIAVEGRSDVCTLYAEAPQFPVVRKPK